MCKLVLYTFEVYVLTKIVRPKWYLNDISNSNHAKNA